MEHFRQCSPHLTIAEVRRQFLVPGYQRQGLRCRQTVSDGATKDGECAFGRYEAFEDDAELLRTLQGALVVFLVFQASAVLLGIDHVLQRLQIHRMEHIAAVVVESKHGAIGIPAIAYVPLFNLTASGVYAELIVLSTSLSQQALDG